MLRNAFEIDEYIVSKLFNENGEKARYSEHEFVASCLRIGITINDLNKLTYSDIMKILISFVSENKEETRIATQNDIDNILG